MSQREYFLNFAYTVLARTTSLDGLMLLHNSLGIERFKSSSFFSGFENLKQELARLLPKPIEMFDDFGDELLLHMEIVP